MNQSPRSLTKTVVPHAASRCTIWLPLAAAFLLVAPAVGVSAEKIDLKVEFDNSAQCRVTSQYEHAGDVIVLKASDTTQTQTLPMQVKARLDYFQRYTGNAKENQAIRFYQHAQSKIQVDKGDTVSQLSADNRHIVTRIAPKAARRIQLASLGKALRQSEFELLRNPADPLTVPTLINRADVAEGDKWKADIEALTDFLAVDRIIRSDVQLLLKSIEDGQAKVFFAGKVRADVDDVTTDLELSGAVLVDLKSQTFSSLRLALRQDRERGQMAPGFVGKTKVDLRLVNSQQSEQLSSATIKQLTAGKKVQQRLRWISKTGNFELQYEPSWRLIAAEKEAAILRYLDDGELMAQCNVVRLPSRPADNPLTLAEFKVEVGKMLDADDNAAVEDARQLQSRSGLNVLEVQVSGTEEEVPLNWLYFHVSSNDGRCVTFVFTLEEELAGKVHPAARQLVNSLSFLAKRPSKSQARTDSGDSSLR